MLPKLYQIVVGMLCMTATIDAQGGAPCMLGVMAKQSHSHSSSWAQD